MRLAIVAYPDLDEEDRQWIEGVRRIHDPQALKHAAPDGFPAAEIARPSKRTARSRCCAPE